MCKKQKTLTYTLFAEDVTVFTNGVARIKIARAMWKAKTNPSPEAWTYRGFHGTDSPGAGGILTDRKLRGSVDEVTKDVAPLGVVYFNALQQPRNSSELFQHFEKCRATTKNLCGLFYELRVIGRCHSTKSGGVWRDMEICYSDEWEMSHYVSEKGRWRTHPDYAQIEAIWVEPVCLEDVDGVASFA